MISSNGGLPEDAITLDEDSISNWAARESDLTVHTCMKPLTQRAAKKVKQTSFSQAMFQGRLKADRDDSQKRFSTDIAQRCQTELQAASQTFPGDFVMINWRHLFVLDVIINCYKGDHLLCQDYSLVCRKGKQWESQFEIYSDGHRGPTVTVVSPTESDVEKVRQCLAM